MCRPGSPIPRRPSGRAENPKVSLLFSDPVGSGMPNPPVVLVQGLATVRDAGFSLPGNRFRRTVHFLRNVRRLSPRVASEAARRGEPIPKINLPQAS